MDGFALSTRQKINTLLHFCNNYQIVLIKERLDSKLAGNAVFAQAWYQKYFQTIQ